jgi:ketopantoate reductase
VGRGVIGAIYGYMLTRGGYDVTHLLKKDKPYAKEIIIDPIDERPEKFQFKKTKENPLDLYVLKSINYSELMDIYDLVILPIPSNDIIAVAKYNGI